MDKHKSGSTRNNTNLNVKNNNQSQVSKKKIEIRDEKVGFRYNLVFIFIILCVIPLIVRLRTYNPNMSQQVWFPNVEQENDVFLIAKKTWFSALTFFVAFAIAGKIMIQKKQISFPKIFIPLASYAVLILLSTIFSTHRSASMSGSFEQFEPVFVLLGYCLIVYYIYLFVEKESDFLKIQYFITGFAVFIGLIGVFQFFGHDLFSTELGKSIIIPEALRSTMGLTLNFGKGVVYLTLYNPNYVGVYVAMIVPVLLFLLFFQKKAVQIAITIVAIVFLLICGKGSQSMAGIIGLAAAFGVILIFMRRYLMKNTIVAIAAGLLIIVGLVFAATYNNHALINRVFSAFDIKKTEYKLSDIQTEDDGIRITYNNNTMKMKLIEKNDMLYIDTSDSENKFLTANYDKEANKFTIIDERFFGLEYGFEPSNVNSFYIASEGYKFNFMINPQDGKYYYINAYGKLDQMKNAPSAIFTGYDNLASGRGYIWSRTIPLCKNYFFIGSGPDTYAYVFPHQDYLNYVRAGYGGEILSKPHSMYLQMAVQTGVVSLLAFLIFYIIYMVNSINLYIRGRFTSYYAKLGAAVFAGTVSYMVTGLTNDSNINTAPMFWVLIGVGIALNHKAKPLILKEAAEIKELRLQKKLMDTSKKETDK